MESADPKRIIVTESCCHACNVHSFLVHHQTFPEMRVEAMSADRAARQLANRLESALSNGLRSASPPGDPASHRRRPSLPRPRGLCPFPL